MRIQTPAPVPTDDDMTRMIVEGLQDPQTLYEIYNRLKNLKGKLLCSEESLKEN